MAVDAQGRVLAIRVRTRANIGAYATGAGVAIQLLVGPWVTTSIYDIGTVDLHFTAVLSNRAPTGPYRGAGRPEAIYLTERLMDAAARKAGIDPAELRRRNMVKPAQMPYKNPMGQVYDVGEFEKILDQGLELADWKGYAARREESKRNGKLRGRGIATFLEWTGGNALEEKVEVTVSPDGYIEIVTATQQMGQGIQTSYAQLAVDIFEVPIGKIRIVQGDTDRANGFGSAGSRSLFTGGAAVSVGSQQGPRPRERPRGRGARGLGGGRGVPRRALRCRRHRSRRRTSSSSRPSRARRASTSTRAPRRARPRGPTHATSARWRSIPQPARWRSWRTRR